MVLRRGDGLLSFGIDSIEAQFDLDPLETGFFEPRSYILDSLRVIVSGRQHVERAQDLHFFEFLVGVIKFRLMRERPNRDQICDGLACDRYLVKCFLHLKQRRDGPAQHGVKGLGLHPPGEWPRPVFQWRYAPLPPGKIPRGFPPPSGEKKKHPKRPPYGGAKLEQPPTE